MSKKSDQFFEKFFVGVEVAVDESTKEFIQTATDDTYEDIIARVPVDTGDLMHSIQKETTDTRGKIYTDLYYALPVELGTFKMEAQPYFEPAYNDLLARIDNEVNILADNIERKL